MSCRKHPENMLSLLYVDAVFSIVILRTHVYRTASLSFYLSVIQYVRGRTDLEGTKQKKCRIEKARRVPKTMKAEHIVRLK